MKPTKSHTLSLARLCHLGLLSLALLSISACSPRVQHLQSTNWVVNQTATRAMVAYIESYKYSQQVDPAELPSALKEVTPQMSKAVHDLFGGKRNFPRELAAKRIAKWLIAEDGLGMKYDIDANFSPVVAYAERRGNCLSFTLLLEALTREMGIPIHVNEVDIPTNWGLNDNDSMVFYRHVNAVQSANGRNQVFDLALDQYRFEYPQRRIKLEHGYAQLFSNQAVDALKENDLEKAEHLMKLALSTYSDDASLWVNYGVINEHRGNDKAAELIFRHALAVDPLILVGVTNLARFLDKKGRNQESVRLQEIADDIRDENPYFHFLTAENLVESGNFAAAQAHIDEAIRLNSDDARFFALRSKIALADRHFRKAYVDMRKAYRLTNYPDERDAYRNKAAWISGKRNMR